MNLHLRLFFAAPLASLLFLLALQVTPAECQDADVYKRGRTLSEWLLAGKTDSLSRVLSPEFLSAVGGSDGVAKLAERLKTQAGSEVEVLQEQAFREGGHTTYYRQSRYEKLPDVTAKWVWDDKGAVVGATVTPSPEPAASEFLGYSTKTPLRLPFRSAPGGAWYVAWGGRNPIDNYHVVAPDQRFAYDFLVVRGNSIHAGDGSRNEDYYCFGQPVYAPAAGRVVTIVDTVADNARPGQKNPQAPPGNHIVIDHGRGEFSLLAHFRRGSIVVRQGEQVQAGARLGKCGNSGNSSLPHVHYHLQTGPAYKEGVGLPAFFNGYFVGGRYVERGEPTRGQMLLPAEQDAGVSALNSATPTPKRYGFAEGRDAGSQCPIAIAFSASLRHT